MDAADSLRQLDREWDARMRETFPEAADRWQFWQKVLHDQPQDEPEHQADARPDIPVVTADTSMAEYARLREELGIHSRGLDSGQRQGTGYRGLQLLPSRSGADNVRAAQALAAESQAVQRAVNARNHQAVETLYGFRRSGR